MGRPAVATSRFATAGCFTAEQLEKGADLEAIQESQASDGPDFDPDDKRSLYERLMEQKDAKQAEWEHRHTFKNQMDHWRLDGDEAGFEDDRLEKQRREHAEAARKAAAGTYARPAAPAAYADTPASALAPASALEPATPWPAGLVGWAG